MLHQGWLKDQVICFKVGDLATPTGKVQHILEQAMVGSAVKDKDVINVESLLLAR